jgi:hypothetical protein
LPVWLAGLVYSILRIVPDQGMAESFSRDDMETATNRTPEAGESGIQSSIESSIESGIETGALLDEAAIAPRVEERRAEPRSPVDARVVLLLVKSATAMPGRILDLSLSGCQIRTQERFTLGIFVRVEVDFHLRGMTFRLGGVTQSIHDVYTVGVRFLAVSERSRVQLAELISELHEGV